MFLHSQTNASTIIASSYANLSFGGYKYARLNETHTGHIFVREGSTRNWAIELTNSEVNELACSVGESK